MYGEARSFGELRRSAANEILEHWAGTLRFPTGLRQRVAESLSSDSAAKFGAGIFRSLRDFVAGFTHRVPHWTELEQSCIEDLGRRMQHLMTIHTANPRLQISLQRHLSELFISYGDVLNSYASGKEIEEKTFSLLRLRELLSRHYAGPLEAAEGDFERNFFRAQLETRSTAPEFIGKLLDAARSNPLMYQFMQRNLIDYLRRNEITGIYGIAMGGGGIAASIAAMARDGGFESRLPLGVSCGFLIPTRRTSIEEKLYDMSGNVVAVRPGPALPKKFSAAPHFPHTGRILVIDDVLTKDSRTRAAVLSAFGKRLGQGRAIFAAGDGTRYSEGGDVSLFDLFMPAASTRQGASETNCQKAM